MKQSFLFYAIKFIIFMPFYICTIVQYLIQFIAPDDFFVFPEIKKLEEGTHAHTRRSKNKTNTLNMV
jgi:hypothetical protein